MMMMDESDAANSPLTKLGGIGDRKRGRPKFRWCDKLKEDVTHFGCRN
jgi:hypothetical protein